MKIILYSRASDNRGMKRKCHSSIGKGLGKVESPGKASENILLLEASCRIAYR